MDFEWDEAKAEANDKKHGVTFDEAQSVFDDPLADAVPDPDHSEGEERFLLLGQSRFGRILVTIFTDRSGKIRIISSRSATRIERRSYEENV